MRKDFRTPLGKALGLGSAKEGAEHFLRQRLTALANVPLFVFFVGLVVFLVGKDYESVHSILANPFIAGILLLMIFAGIYHMKLGMQVIIEDYMPHPLCRTIFLALNIFFCFAIAALSMLAILKITLGG